MWLALRVRGIDQLYTHQAAAIDGVLRGEHVGVVTYTTSGKTLCYNLPVLNTLLRDKVLFGTDFPLFTPERWMADFEKLPIKDEVRPLVLKENAMRLFGFQPAA